MLLPANTDAPTISPLVEVLCGAPARGMLELRVAPLVVGGTGVPITIASAVEVLELLWDTELLDRVGLEAEVL